MKLHRLMLWAGTVLLCACQPAVKETQVKGKLTGLENDTLLLTYYAASDLQRHGFIVKDTIVAQDGAFTYKVEKDSLPVRMILYPKPKDGSMLYRTAEIPVLPGATVSVSGSITDYKLEGGAFYDAYSAMKALLHPYEEKVHALTDVVIGLQGTDKWTPQVSDSLRTLYKAAVGEMVKVQEDYVRKHLDEDVSVYMFSNMGQKSAVNLLPLLGEKARTGVFAALYQAIEEALKVEEERDAAQKRIVAGVEAPDFTLKDLQGNDFSLSSLRGKYVLLDFWGSWCGWCIKGFPELKTYYGKYKERMEVVGVDCNDTEEKWKKAVADHGLDWVHVRNEGNPDVSVMYGIAGYPTKILIDPQGKILRVAVGEDPTFYEYLDKLFK